MGYMKKLSAFAPILSVIVIAVFAFISLSGYVKPVYAVETPSEAEQAAANGDNNSGDEAAAAAVGSFELEDGTYEGTGMGFKGEVKVSVEIKDKQIVAINILSSSDDEAFFSRAKGVIDKIIQAQSLDVDVVSGATYSSNGIINAVKNALTGETDDSTPASSGSSGGQGSTSVSDVEEPDGYKDGTYTGTGTGFGGPLTVQVVVKDGKIASIEITDNNDDASYLNKAKALISKIISTQSTNVDTVSGATYSSVGIINAVRKALEKAAITTSSDPSPSPSPSASASADLSGKFPYNDGIYYGVGEGYIDDIKVAVVIQNKTIKAILIIESQDDAAFFNRAKTIATEVVEKQSTKVDVVSGATYSSNGIINAIKAALKAAKDATNGVAEPTVTPSPSTEPSPSQSAQPGESEEPSYEPTTYKNGTYTATVVCKPDEDEDFEAYNLTLKVEIKDDKIVAVSDIAGDGDSGNDSYIKRAANGTSSITGVVAQILEKGAPEGIDAVSRATCTSKSIIEACEKAMQDAKDAFDAEVTE